MSRAEANTSVDWFEALTLDTYASADEMSLRLTSADLPISDPGISLFSSTRTHEAIVYSWIIIGIVAFVVCGFSFQRGEPGRCRTFMQRGPRPESQARNVRGSSFDLAVAATPAPAVANSATPSVGDSSPLFGGYDVVNAILEVAHNVAQQSQVPGVCEAAMLVSTLVNLISADRTNIADAEERLQRCHLLATMLQRAATVLEQVDTIEDTDSGTSLKRMLIDDVGDAIRNMVGLIKTYRSKRRITQVVVSTLFKRRMEEAEAVIDRTFEDMMRWLQIDIALQQGEDRRTSIGNRRSLTETKQEQETPEDLRRQQQAAEVESIASARRTRRQRNLDQIEISEDSVTISEDLLGKGGFGSVYIADYGGMNAAAKVIGIANENRRSRSGRGDDDLGRGTSQNEAGVNRLRASLLLELQAMIRLRSPCTVNVYGAITSRQDQIVLVMELLTGGDLSALLRHSKQRFSEAQARRIIGDVCDGMAFLHSKNTIHGDLKSANVLLDGEGRAKIGDFGTSRWAQHNDYTGLATYTTSEGVTMHMMSFAWAAPEVLDERTISYASDVYSFAIVAWEVLSMKVPWAKAFPFEIYRRVVFKGDRPEIPVDTPGDIACIMRACWAGAPAERPTSIEIRERLKERRLQGKLSTYDVFGSS